jgi:hypothetical protein
MTPAPSANSPTAEPSPSRRRAALRRATIIICLITAILTATTTLLAPPALAYTRGFTVTNATSMPVLVQGIYDPQKNLAANPPEGAVLTPGMQHEFQLTWQFFGDEKQLTTVTYQTQGAAMSW